MHEQEDIRVPWWVRPHTLLFAFIIPAYVVLSVVGFAPRYGHRYLTPEYIVLGLAFLLVVAGTSLVASRVGTRTPTVPILRANPLYLDGLAILTVTAYLIWFWKALVHPEIVLRVVLGLSMNARDEISTIPGLTTLTQLGVAYAVLFACYRWAWNVKLRKRYTVYLALIVLFALFRTVAWSERLATLEVLVPLLIVYASTWRVRRPLARAAVAVGPFIGVGFLILFFAVTESFRSWGKQQFGGQDLAGFMLDRFGQYYVSALNNGAGLLTEFHWPRFDFEFTLKWLYAFPGIGPLVQEFMSPAPVSAFFLHAYGDPEFTTYSGIFPVFYDAGILIAFLSALVLGGLTGAAYRQFRFRGGPGILLYPVLYIHLLEILRILYLGESRVVPVLFFLLLGFVVLFVIPRQAGRRYA